MKKRSNSRSEWFKEDFERERMEGKLWAIVIVVGITAIGYVLDYFFHFIK